MELWGTLTKSAFGWTSGPSASTDSSTTATRASNEYIDKFFDTCNPAGACQQEAMKDFVSRISEANPERKVAVVTSGSTVVPLNSTRFIDSPTSGNRGAAIAEHLLKNGYAVVFLHRRGTLQPFSKHFTKYIRDGAFLNILQIQEESDTIQIQSTGPTRDRLGTIIRDYQEVQRQESLLLIEFQTVEDYLYLLKAAALALKPLESKASIILAAAVSSYFVENSDRLLQRRDSELSVRFVRVPKLLARIRREWAPKAYLVTFKLVENESDMRDACHNSIDRWGMDMVVGNCMETRREKLFLVTERMDEMIQLHAESASIAVEPVDSVQEHSKSNFRDIEELLTNIIVEEHRKTATERLVLGHCRQLLLLSAKFSMMKERDTLNEDAHGSRNVEWSVGIQIRPNRNNPNSAIYELKAIFNNSSHSARCHIWERVASSGEIPEIDESKSSVSEEGESKEHDVLVSFSPAGTPDTIKDLWSDFWNGWPEERMHQVKSALSEVMQFNPFHVTATTSSVRRLFGELGLAWSEGEQTRIRQSLSNLVAVGFNRRLVELEKVSGSESSDDKVPKVHERILEYFLDMQRDGIVDCVANYLREGRSVILTGYSMGGMLAHVLAQQLIPVYNEIKVNGNRPNLHCVVFGTPRVGDEEFARSIANAYVDYGTIVNVMHPFDTVHAYPPLSEGYADIGDKVFVKSDPVNSGQARTGVPASLARLLDRTTQRFFSGNPVSVHQLSDIGILELAVHFRFHHFLYYSSNLKNFMHS